MLAVYINHKDQSGFSCKISSVNLSYMFSFLGYMLSFVKLVLNNGEVHANNLNLVVTCWFQMNFSTSLTNDVLA